MTRTPIDLYRSLLRTVHIQRLLRGADLLAASTWAGRTGVSEMPPLGPGGDMKTWSRQARVDVPELQRYGQAVYATTDGGEISCLKGIQGQKGYPM